MEEGDWPLTELPIPARGDYPITPRRLLANRAGVQHYSDSDPALPGGTPSEGDKMANPGFLWALSYWTDNPLVLLPGTGWNYSSFGFNMAGAALDVAVPGQYFDWVRTRIAEMTVPSEMLFLHPDDVYDPTYDGAPWFTTANRAYGYAKTEEGVIVQNQTPGDVSYKVPSGGFISTTADMALFAEGLLNNRFLDEAGMDEVLTPQANRVLGIEPPPTSGYALGFSIGQRSGERFVAHNGGQQDAASRLCFFPDGEDPSVGKLAIVVMSNTRYLNRNAITNGVEALLRNPYVDLQGPIVFNGNEPRNPDWAADDLASRDAMENGPFANDGTYAQPDLDRYRAPVFRVDTSHRYDPNYEWDAPVESPDEVGEDDEPGVPGVIVLPNPR